jgi:hypothetical protein
MSVAATRNESARPLELLRQLSWHAEKLLKREGNFRNVVWLSVDAAGDRQLQETKCTAPPDVTDHALIAALAGEMSEEFRSNNIAAFAVAYPARRLQPVRASVICFEAHGRDEHWRAEREIVPPSRRGAQPTLLALSEIGRVADGLYAGVL